MENEEELLQQNGDQEQSLVDSPTVTPLQVGREYASPQDQIEANTVQGSFPAPFRSRIGSSSVDLSVEANTEKMKSEMDEWWNYGKKRGFLGIPYIQQEFKGERDKLKDAWYRKYHGMSLEDYEVARKQDMEEHGGFYGTGSGWKGAVRNMDNNFQALSVPGLAYADFANDALGTVVPGYDKVDDRWDEATKLDNPIYENVRKILSIVLPAIHTGGKTSALLRGSPTVQNLPLLQRSLVSIGAYGLADSAVTLLSDTSEDHNVSKTMSDLVPGLFGPGGITPIPEAWKTKESQSPAARKMMNFYENGVLSTFGTILGVAIDAKSGVKTPVDFIEPIDESAAQYKRLEAIRNSNADDLVRLQELNTLISSGKLNKQVETQILDEILQIEDRLGVILGVDDTIKAKDIKSKLEQQAAARRKLDADPDAGKDAIDPDITPGLLDKSSEARSVPPPANVARNIADTTAIKNGTSKGDPAPIITEAMREKGLMVGNKSRDAVMGVAEETRDIGRFNAVVDGIRYTAKQMNAAAWDIYTSIIAADNIDDVRALFLENRDVKNFLLGRFKVEVINEEQARAAAFALRDLTDRFLGREVSEASARVMDTLGRESATLAETIQQGAGYVDDNRVMDLIIEKMQFLLDEYALNKYIAGWQLRNKNWFDQVPPKELDDVIEQLTEEFTNAENAIHARNLRFTNTLKEVRETKPHFLRPLVDAYAHTNGDVDTLIKLNKYAAGQISPLSLLKSPNPKQMSLFAKATWSVVMNNVLSGLSAFRAALGNTYSLTVKPITQILGHGFWGAVDGDFTGVKMTMYANGAIFETNRRAVSDAFEMMKKAHKDPEMMMRAYRKDFQIQDAAEWQITEGMRQAWDVEGDWGKTIQYDLARNLRDLGKHPAMRYGMTGLVFPDAYTSTMLAHYLSRVKAYDDVFSELGYFKRSAVLVAEARHYQNFFDANGLIKDDVLRAVAGEIQLNLDDGLATWMNQATNAYPITKMMMMFPRTSSNAIKFGSSWTPLSLIPGFNKYSKTIYARTSDDVAQALIEHGIDPTTANADTIFKNLRAEYTGRLAFSGLLVGTLWSYAMAGNIRGSGHYNASRRSKERDNFGYEPFTINIGGKWVSYKDTPLRYVLGPLGDMAYYASDLNQPMLEDWQAKLVWTLAASFLNDSPLQGFEPLVAATNGDLSAWNRLIANSTRALIPLSGAQGVLANAISSSQKDLDGSIQQYVMNRIPGLNLMLAEQIDIWTGKPLNDVDHPVLKMLNALSPVKVSGTNEPWRQWLQEIQYDGLSRLTKDSSGSYEYTAKEREWIYRRIGEMELYKEIERIMKNPEYQKQIKALRLLRSSNINSVDGQIEIKEQMLPVYTEIDSLLRDALMQAEYEMLNARPDIAEKIEAQEYVNQRVKSGDVEGAGILQKKNLEKQKLLEFGGSQ